jgi:O-antigen/teichoic acid export membrane protein
MLDTCLFKNKFTLRSFKFLHDSSIRSERLNRNILLSLVSKGMSVLSGFMLVPICLNYLGKEKYGIWLTLSSLVGWLSFLEIGLGNGLRNKLSESLAVKNITKGKILVSTTYAILFIICLLSSILFIMINRYLDWAKILNTDHNMYRELNVLALIVFNSFVLRLLFNLINIVLYADQKPGIANMFGPFASLLSLGFVYIITRIKLASLIMLGTIISGMPVIVFLFVSIYFYFGKYRDISPSIQYIEFKYAGELLNLGVKFFFIQISGIILYQTSNIIIAHCFGPADVTVYGVAYKLFSVLNMLFSIIAIPFWSAFTEAWTLNDFNWIKLSIRKLFKFWLVLLALGIAILICSPYIYNLWLGNVIRIPFHISLLLLIYFSLFTFGSVFNYFINGVGKIKLQLYSSFAGALIFLPLSLFFIKVVGTGIEGIVLAIIISNFFGPFLSPIQYLKIIKRIDTGIWAK